MCREKNRYYLIKETDKKKMVGNSIPPKQWDSSKKSQWCECEWPAAIWHSTLIKTKDILWLINQLLTDTEQQQQIMWKSNMATKKEVRKVWTRRTSKQQEDEKTNSGKKSNWFGQSKYLWMVGRYWLISTVFVHSFKWQKLFFVALVRHWWNYGYCCFDRWLW